MVFSKKHEAGLDHTGLAGPPSGGKRTKSLAASSQVTLGIVFAKSACHVK